MNGENSLVQACCELFFSGNFWMATVSTGSPVGLFKESKRNWHLVSQTFVEKE